MVVRKKTARARAKAAATRADEAEDAEPPEEPPDVPGAEAPGSPRPVAGQVARLADWEAGSAHVSRKQASFVVRLGGGGPSEAPAQADGGREEERIQEVLAMSVLKVVFGEEVRRLRVQLPRATADSGAWLSAVRRAVQQGLGLCEERCAERLQLSYVDASGSARVLGEATAFDCAAHFESDTLRLVADWARPQRREGDVLWAARDGRAHIGLAMTFLGLQPILVVQGYQFEISLRQHEVRDRLVDEAFDGSGVHTALLEDCLGALCSLAHAVAGVPSWHRLELEDGRSLALRLCTELHADDLVDLRHESTAAPQV